MSWTHLSTSHPIARKEYRCIWCSEPILKGEKHVIISGIGDGDFQSNRFHAECYKASQLYFQTTFDDFFDPYEFKRGSMEIK